jgi:transposase
LQIECAPCEDRRMNAYSKDLRIKALGALERGMPRKEAASTFGISLATLKRWLKRRRGKDLAPRPSPGRTPRILATPEQRRALWEQLEANDDATLERHCELWQNKTGVVVSVATMSRAVGRLGWTFKKSRWWPPNGTNKPGPLSGNGSKGSTPSG